MTAYSRTVTVLPQPAISLLTPGTNAIATTYRRAVVYYTTPGAVPGLSARPNLPSTGQLYPRGNRGNV